MSAPSALFPEVPQWLTFSQGFRVDYREDAVSTRHVFCGEHDIRGARCFAGRHPLLRFLSLDTSDERLGLSSLGVPFVHLLYCWRCDVGEFDYRLERDGGVTLLDVPHLDLEDADDYPYDGY